MKKQVIVGFIIFVLSLSLVFAIDIEVTQVEKGNVVVRELGNPAYYELVINNNGEANNFEVYSLVGASIEPRGLFVLNPGNNTLLIKVSLGEDLLKNTGLLKFEYQIKEWNGEIFRDKMLVRLVDLEDSLEVEGGNVKLNDPTAKVKVINLQNANLDNLNVTFSSIFFNSDRSFSLAPFEEKEFELDTNQNAYPRLEAGPFVIRADIQTIEGVNKIDGIADYLEKEVISEKTNSSGLIIQKTFIEKYNEGNVNALATISYKEGVLARLFTTYSDVPDFVERNGLFVDYVWAKEIRPGERYVLEIETNYTFPFILLIVILIVIFVVRLYVMKPISVVKHVSFVKTKGGEFALKVQLRIRAKKDLENLEIRDRLPGGTTLYEKYGTKPDRVDESSRQLFWGIRLLRAGEEKVLSYIVYSKIRVTGSFELPAAQVSYAVRTNKGIKKQLTNSNRAFFVSDIGSID